MFTGIIQSVGVVTSLDGENLIISTNSDKFLNHDLGTSIAVDGVCLTLRGYDENNLTFQVSNESISRSIIKNYTIGDFINLELPLTMETFLSGHIVQGHVDTITTVSNIEQVSDDLWNFCFVNNNYKYLVDKQKKNNNKITGAINPNEDKFSVAIIRETYDRTNFNNLQVDSPVNVEFDIMAKYVERALDDK